MKRADAVDQLKSVYSVLSRDLVDSMAYVRQNHSLFAQRTLIRTYFALVEGVAYQLRAVSLASLEGTHVLAPEEIALLREERYVLDKKGRPEPRENFQSLLPNLLFSINCYLKNHGASFTPDTSAHGWEAMRKLVEIRNRITHPKSEACLTLSEKDLLYVFDAADWWNATLLAMFSACAEADEYWTTQLAAEA